MHLFSKIENFINFNSSRAIKNQLTSFLIIIYSTFNFLFAHDYFLNSNNMVILIWWTLKRLKISKTIIFDWIFFFKRFNYLEIVRVDEFCLYRIKSINVFCWHLNFLMFFWLFRVQNQCKKFKNTSFLLSDLVGRR